MGDNQEDGTQPTTENGENEKSEKTEKKKMGFMDMQKMKQKFKSFSENVSKKVKSVAGGSGSGPPVLANAAKKNIEDTDPETTVPPPKLVHVTATRAAGPASRRAPPSRRPVANRNLAKVSEAPPPPGGFKNRPVAREVKPENKGDDAEKENKEKDNKENKEKEK